MAETHMPMIVGVLIDLIDLLKVYPDSTELYYNDILVTGINEIICRAYINRRDSGDQHLHPIITIKNNNDIKIFVIMDY